MVTCSLKLTTEKIEEKDQFGSGLTRQFMLEFHKPMMVAAIRAFVIGDNRPTNRRTLILEMVAWTRIQSLRYAYQ